MASMTVPAVSVVLPAFNRAETIRAAIASVLRQSWRDFELLVVDDGSTDGTLEAAKAEADRRVRVLSTPRNLGAAGARNHGLAAARAPWIAFQDSDDEWLPEKLARQMARLLEPGAGWIGAHCGMIVMGRAEDRPRARSPGRPAGRTEVRYIPDASVRAPEGDILAEVLRKSFISTQMLVARRDALEAVGGFDEELRALVDWELMLRLAPRGPFAFVDEPLVLQRFSANSITRDRARRAEARARIIAKHRALFARHPAVLARHYRTLAGEHRLLGDIPAARTALAAGRGVRPLDPRLWALSAYFGLRALR
jgi:glycosyltransferase involved in cell wall biosynthesis